jgi:hypothetical protein
MGRRFTDAEQAAIIEAAQGPGDAASLTRRFAEGGADDDHADEMAEAVALIRAGRPVDMGDGVTLEWLVE